MKLTWNGHSCFTLETVEGCLVFDPYQHGSVPGLSPLSLTADLVLCSHAHRDHGARTCVTLTGNSPSFSLEELPSYHDAQQGAERGLNTIHIISAEGMRLAHLGDLGCQPEPEQLERLQHLDVLLIPVGGYYTINAPQANALVEHLKPRVVVPMHYRAPAFGFDVTGPVEDFLALRKDVVRYPGNTLEISTDTPGQTAVLTYLP